MKKILAIVMVLTLLVACRPAEMPKEEPKIEIIELAPEPVPVVTSAPAVEPEATEAPASSPMAAPESVMASEGKTIEISIEKMAFSQEVVTIKKGDTIVWTQNDAVPHTVTVTQGPAADSFDSNVLRQGQTFSHTFNIAGTYYYKCSLHTMMRGKVIVE